jgi:hypothetical protein
MTSHSDRFVSIGKEQIKLTQATGAAGAPANPGKFKPNKLGIENGLYHPNMNRDITSVADLKN